MSENNKHYRTLLATTVALLQLAIAPATHVLHIGCHCADQDEVSAARKSCPHADCSACKHHSQNENERSPAPKPHDSDSCEICHAAFAVTTVEWNLPPQLTIELVGQLNDQSAQLTEVCDTYRLRSRGPPTT